MVLREFEDEKCGGGGCAEVGGAASPNKAMPDDGPDLTMQQMNWSVQLMKQRTGALFSDAALFSINLTQRAQVICRSLPAISFPTCLSPQTMRSSPLHP